MKKLYLSLMKFHAKLYRKRHTNGEQFISLAAIEAVEAIFGDNFAKQSRSIPPSNDTRAQKLVILLKMYSIIFWGIGETNCFQFNLMSQQIAIYLFIFQPRFDFVMECQRKRITVLQSYKTQSNSTRIICYLKGV